MATEAQKKIMNTDYHQEYGFLIDSIRKKMSKLLDLYEDRDISVFDLAQNHGAINWLDRTLSENLDMYDHVVRQRNERDKAKA
jgi:hypothetical protein